MKKSILFLLALFSVAMTTQAAYYYRGDKNSWGTGIQLTQSADGYYYYYEATAGAHNFKILNDATNWGATQWNENNILSLYNGTDVAVTKAGSDQNIKCSATTKHYILFYPKNTKLNGSTNDYICASKTLPNGFGAMHFKHPWNGGDWTYQTATNNGDGTFSFVGKYGGNGVNWCVQKNGTGEKWIASPTLVGSPVTGDDCTFTFNGADQTITITKKVNKNIGDITITMNCTQQPKIFFWDVEGKTCAAWPGEDMVAAGANTYTYTFEDVDVDLGVNYKINLKAVNENEWATGDLHTTTDVTHDASNLNIPTIGMHGNFIDGWKDTEKFTISDDYTSATLTLEGITEGDHEFGMQINGSWTSNGKTFTRNANSAEVKSGSGNLKLTADYTGNYIFTYTYKTQTLEVTYPELPTPEYKDITIQVYAKQVPNIWWWNGGDQCPSTEDIVNPSTGNKYQWNEAPAMEKVAGEDNWYTKTFTQVDITKGGIKFKLQSTDHSTSTTNEVVTSEDKCYDARAIATVTETPCGELPSGEIPTVTYNVTVPAETPACYIAGEMTGWSFTPMTKVDDTHYTITIEGAEKTNKYKYTCDEGWDYVEKKADGSDISDRTWTESDVVEKWGAPAPTYDYYIAGTLAGGWSAKQQGIEKDGELYKATFNNLAAGTYQFKITDGQFNTEEDKTHEHTTLAAEYEEVSYVDGNIQIITEEAINLTVIFNATTDKITFEGLTEKAPAKCYLMGIGGDWTTGIEMEEDGDQFKLLCQPIAEGEQFKFKYGDTWTTDVENYDENGVNWVETTPGSGQYNITLPAGNYDFYYKKATNKVYIAAATDCGPATITLTTGDNSAVIAANIGNTVNVVIERSFTANDGYYTLCVPFNMDPSVIGKAYSLGTITEHVAGEGININLEEETYMLSAGVPYLVLPKANMSELVVENVTIESDPASGQNVTGDEDLNVQIFFEGFYSASGQTNGTTQYYVGNNGYLYNEVVDIRGLCGLFTITDKNGAPLNVRARVVTREDEATGFENITSGENTTIKLIENGQLIIIRGNEKFNAQGVRL